MHTLPSGTVTFLFTDIEGSCGLWQDQPAAARSALLRHDGIVQAEVEKHHGLLVHERGEGDSRFAVFARASDAVAAAADIQLQLLSEPWPTATPLRVRIALNTGEAEVIAGDYYGSPVNRCARLRDIAAGGQTLLSQSTLDLVRDELPATLTVRDLGLHRLKDLARPEHVYQLLHPDLPAEFPPLKSLDFRAHNLPVQPTPLIGRGAEVARLCHVLTDRDVRLLTLTGAGGTGKTRLALQVAADLLDHFEDGVCFVACSALRDPGLLASTMGAALGLKDAAGVAPMLSLQEHIGARRMLCILDNFEQIVDAAPTVAELLGACPGLRLLVTSRTALHLRAEHEFPVAPFAPPRADSAEAFESIAQNEAVRLFVARAQAVKPDFSLTRDNAPAVVEICIRLDGLPLAIELAAARVKMFPPAALLDRLVNRLQVLTGGSRDLPERHQTLRNTVAWSYDLLTESERALFRRLTVFAGGCTSEAAGEVCNLNEEFEADVLDRIGFLIDKSLLRQEEQDGQPRFLMLETIREFGSELLVAAGEEEALHRRHARYFLRLAERAEPWLLTSGQFEWLDRLEAENDNLRAALAWSLKSRDVHAALSLATCLWCFWLIYGHVDEGWEHLSTVLAQPQAGEFPAEYAKLTVAAGAVAYFRGDHDRALELCAEGLPLCRAAGARFQQALSLSLLGGLCYFRGDFEEATAQWEESKAIAEELGNRWLISVLLPVMGVLALHRGQVQRSLELCRQGLEYAREVGENWTINQALYNAGLACIGSRDFARARSHFLEGLAVSRSLNFYLGISLNLVGLAGIAVAQGEFERAACLLGAGNAIRDAVDVPIPPGYQTDYRRIHEATSRGMDGAAFATALAAGFGMSVEQALAFGSMDGESPYPHSSPPAFAPPHTALP